MKKYLFTLFFVIFFLSFFIFLQLPKYVFAATQQVQCTCKANNGKGGVAGNGNNGYACTDGHTGACGNLEQSCVPKSGNIIGTGSSGGNCTVGQAKNGGCTPPTTTQYVGVACQDTNNGKQDITCACSGPTTKRGFPTEVSCTDSVTNTTNTQACGGNAVCVVGVGLSYQESNSANQSVQGIGCEQDCVCDHPNTAGNGNNGWKCYNTDGTLGTSTTGNTNSCTAAEIGKGTCQPNIQTTTPDAGSCPNREDVCQNNINATNGVKCVDNTTCTCKGNTISCISKGAGDNGADETYTYDCGSSSTCTQGGDINDPNFSAFNQHISGIECQPNISPTLPPPPSPPCSTWVDGECTQFASGIGLFSTEPETFTKSIFAILLSASGGLALLLIIRAGYQLMTSQGKPEQIQQGRDQLIAAIVGLLFLIFSFVALQLIGVDILHLPGFQASTSTSTSTTCNPSQCVPATQCQALVNGTGAGCVATGCPAGEECSP